MSHRALLFLGRTDLCFPEKEAALVMLTFPVFFNFPLGGHFAPIEFAYADAILIPSCHQAVNSNLAQISFAYHYFLAHALKKLLREK